MRSHWYRLGARLSLFAMLMALLGPLISQGASLAHGAGASFPAPLAAPLAASLAKTALDGDEIPCDETSSASTGHDTHHHDCADHGPTLWERCGYCTLLFQHPPLTESRPFTSGPRLVSTAIPPVLFTSEQTAPPVFPGARTRAPPRLT